MSNKVKDNVRPIYTELQGYLSQAPELKMTTDTSYDKSLWEDFHRTLEELNKITGNNYDKFQIPIDNSRTVGPFMHVSSYRGKLSGLINRLYGEYFSDEVSPLGKFPNTIIQQFQNQSQTTFIQLILDINSKIERGLSEAHDQNEKDFLQKLKESLPNITNAVQVIGLIFDLANKYGISVASLAKFFGF